MESERNQKLSEPAKFKVALKGILAAKASEVHFRFHLVAAFAVIIAGALLKVTKNDWLWLIMAIGLVLTAELFNTAIENLVDLVSPDHHHLAGKVKDISAGAVLVASLIAAIIGIMIFWPYF